MSAVKRQEVIGQLNVLNGLLDSSGVIAFHSKMIFNGGLFGDLVVGVTFILLS